MEGVDVLFVGTMDLRLQLESYPERATRDYAACLREVAAAAESAGKACGLLLRQTDDAAALQALGFTHLAIETDITRPSRKLPPDPVAVEGTLYCASWRTSSSLSARAKRLNSSMQPTKLRTGCAPR